MDMVYIIKSCLNMLFILQNNSKFVLHAMNCLVIGFSPDNSASTEAVFTSTQKPIDCSHSLLVLVRGCIAVKIHYEHSNF